MSIPINFFSLAVYFIGFSLDFSLRKLTNKEIFGENNFYFSQIRYLRMKAPMSSMPSCPSGMMPAKSGHT